MTGDIDHYFTRPAPIGRRGELRNRETIHWEHSEFRGWFPGKITPTDIDGLIADHIYYVERNSRFLVFEFKHTGAANKYGQHLGFSRLRDERLLADDRVFFVRHGGDGDDVWPDDIQHWTAQRGGGGPTVANGFGHVALGGYIRQWFAEVAA